MIHYVIARHDRKLFNKHIKKSLPKKRKNYIIDDRKDLNSMSAKYNEARSQLIANDLKDDDIVIFVHEDVELIDFDFENKVNFYFDKVKDCGVGGVYGTTTWAGGGWWHHDRTKNARGQITQGNGRSDRFVMKENNLNTRVLLIDGCILMVRGKLLKQLPFDTELKGYHHYDNRYCLDTLLTTDFKNYIFNIMVFHKSSGPLNTDWVTGDSKTQYKYTNKGLTLPIDLHSIETFKRNI